MATPSPPLCAFFLAGTCQKADGACKYSHDIAARDRLLQDQEIAEASPQVTEIDITCGVQDDDFAGGRCLETFNCPYHKPNQQRAVVGRTLPYNSLVLAEKIGLSLARRDHRLNEGYAYLEYTESSYRWVKELLIEAQGPVTEPLPSLLTLLKLAKRCVCPSPCLKYYGAPF